VPAIADLLGTCDRQRLERLAHPEDTQALALDAREAAAVSSGIGMCAWLLVACTLRAVSTTDEAREVLAETLPDGELRIVALACLGSLTSAHDHEETP
jgi:hypothetical protein